MTHNMIPGYLSDHQGYFSVMSLHCQSINATFGQLEALLNDLQCSNFMFSVICLQETWLSTNSSTADIFNLPGYQTISFGSSVGNHDGFIIYIRDDFKFKVKTVNIPSKLWECQFLEIPDGLLPQPIILRNIYPPPRNNNDNSTIRNFTNELSTVLNDFTKLNYNIIITGDFNINLLEIYERECYGDFLYMMLSNELFPKISLPTRKCRTKVSLIDQYFCIFKYLKKRIKSGKILGATSDHYAYFPTFEVCKAYKPSPKCVRINVSNDAALVSFVTEVSTAGIYEKLDINILSDPTQNNNKIEKTILEAKEKHLPPKIMRLNKHRHKISPWITNGILASIRHRDKIYYQKSQIPTTDANHHILESNLKMYSRVLNRLYGKLKGNIIKTR